jgi:hypothetical protein
LPSHPYEILTQIETFIQCNSQIMIVHAGVVGFLEQQAQQHLLSPHLHWLNVKFTSHLLLVQGSQARGTRTACGATVHFMQLTH